MLSLASGESMQRAVSHDFCGSSAAIFNRLMGHIWCGIQAGMGPAWSGAGLLSQECGASCPSVCTKHYPILTLG